MTTKKSTLKEKSEKVGKALARSTFKAESAGRTARKKVEDIVGKVSQKTQKTVDKITHIKPGRKKATGKKLFAPSGSLSVVEQVGLTAGDIYHYLQGNGKVPVEKVVNAMKRRKNTQAIAAAALGWLAREDKIVFDKDGAQVWLR